MTHPVDPLKDFTDADLAGMAKRVAINSVHDAEHRNPGVVGLGHYYAASIESAALEVLRACVLHERQRAGRDTASLRPTTDGEAS